MALLASHRGGRWDMGVVSLLPHPLAVGDAVNDPLWCHHLHRVSVAYGTLILGLRDSSVILSPQYSNMTSFS